jgi:hypothetical protein
MSTQALSRVRAIADTLYQDLYYTIGYSCTAGVGNGIGCARENERFDHGFGEGFCNNFPLGTVLNLMYPLLFRANRGKQPISKLCTYHNTRDKSLFSWLALLHRNRTSDTDYDAQCCHRFGHDKSHSYRKREDKTVMNMKKKIVSWP